MKKTIAIGTVIALPFVVNAQESEFSNSNISAFNLNAFNVIATIFAVALFMGFFLTIIKRFMDFRLKNKIIDKGIPENLISAILQPEAKEGANINIKWFSILASLGAALTIIHYTQPLGIHSLAIMAFCIAAGFLGYFFFIKAVSK
jgi:hypothetical protein